MEQFADFYKYCEAIDSWGMKTGIVKVVPPKEWLDALPSIRASDVAQQEQQNGYQPGSQPTLESVRIKSAIEQHFRPNSKSGLWRQTNVTRPAKVWNVKQWSDVCKSNPGPAYDRVRDLVSTRQKMESGQDVTVDLGSDGVRTRSGKTKVAQPSTSQPQATPSPHKKRKLDTAATERPSADPSVADDNDGIKTPPVWSGLGHTTKPKVEALEDDLANNQDHKQHAPSSQSNSPRPRRHAQSHETHPSPTAPPRQAKPKVKTADLTTPAEWAEFDYKTVWLDEWAQGSSNQPSPTDWTPEMCREIEGEYWRGLNFGQPPMYGADLKGTLFTPETKAWNVNSLDNLLTRLKLKRKIAGVTDPYLYFGMWRATFAWHVEDMDLYSINYIHFGAPKQWYAIPQKDRVRFENSLRSAFPQDAQRCSQFMRHKSFLASPSFLRANNIRPLKMVQHAGEFIITYPFGYHSGYNLGFNCAESVNFALDSWIDIGRKAKACECEDAQQSVIMDVDALLEESQELETAQRRREEREEAKRRRTEENADAEAAAERKRAIARAKRAEKKQKLEQDKLAAAQAQSQAQAATCTTQDWGPDDLPELRLLCEVASSRPSHTSTALPAESSKLCSICPLDSTEDIVPVGECPPGEDAVYAHALCANSIPECWVAPQDENDDDSPLEVKGYWNIAKARWSLKCTLCTTPQLAKGGCCAQCTFGNCAKAVHPSCAAMETSGWFMDMLNEDEADRLEARGKYAVKKTGKSGKGKASASSASASSNPQQGEIADSERMVILCRSHNPISRAKDRLRKGLVLRESIKRIPPRSAVKARYTDAAAPEALYYLQGLRDFSASDSANAIESQLGRGEALLTSHDGGASVVVPWDEIVISKEIQDEASKVVAQSLDRLATSLVQDAANPCDDLFVRTLAERTLHELDQTCVGQFLDDQQWDAATHAERTSAAAAAQ